MIRWKWKETKAPDWISGLSWMGLCVRKCASRAQNPLGLSQAKSENSVEISTFLLLNPQKAFRAH